MGAELGHLPVQSDPELTAFYEARSFRPLWVEGAAVRPEARTLLALIERAPEDGLNPQRYDLPALAAAIAVAEQGRPDALARAEALLSRAYADYVRDLRQPAGDPGTFFVDAELAPQRLTARQALEAAAAAPSLAEHLAGVRRMNPLYEDLRRGLAAWRAAGGADPARERLIRANLERARGIPADPGRRFILVDAAGARLWLYEDGRVVDTMRAIVGKPSQQTPAMAGLIRFAVLNPYWNLPQDLVPGRVARHVLSRGPDYLRRERMEILSDYTAGALRLDPSEVDWPAVAAGRQRLRVRQLPGAGNMMGKVKFMMPNRLGIYLHDTPDKSSFGRADRRLSSGCVRVEDAERLSRWLFGGQAIRAAGAAAEQRVDLPAPVPVYITYLTAAPAEDGGIAFQADAYGRDPEWLARLEAKAAPAA